MLLTLKQKDFTRNGWRKNWIIIKLLKCKMLYFMESVINREMLIMGIKIYNKLIRDKIPEIIAKSGKKAIVEKVDGEEYFRLLNEKLGEELNEYMETYDIEELADLVEIIYAILDYQNVTVEEFENIRKKKAQQRGAFKERLVLLKVFEE
jgi:predicted house-cleaning noncanonical NTP pyrophosphatase (MazG superfamily)